MNHVVVATPFGMPIDGARTVHVAESDSDFFTRNMIKVLLEHRFPQVQWSQFGDNGDWEHLSSACDLPLRKYATWIATTGEALSEHGNFVLGMLSQKLDRFMYEPAFEASEPWPKTFEPFPRWERLRRNLASRKRSQRRVAVNFSS